MSSRQEPLIIAHGGTSGYLPEHTLKATVLAFGLGADYIEPDVVLSMDDVPVILHDVHHDTTSDVAELFPSRARVDGRFYAIDFTVSELKMLSVIPRFDRQINNPVYSGRYPNGKPRFQIATLEEAIQLIKGLNASTRRELGIYPEIQNPSWHLDQGKYANAAVVSLLSHYGYIDRSDKCFLQCSELSEPRRICNELGYEGSLNQLIGGLAEGEDGTDYNNLQTSEGLIELSEFVEGIGPPIDLVVTANSEGTDGGFRFEERKACECFQANALSQRCDLPT